jgi:polar amino acid transport system substrate-binding protein
MHLSRTFVVLSLVVTAVALAACGDDDDSEPANTTQAKASACAKDQLALVSPGTLTVGTDKPAFPPYFVDDDPTNGKGFESAVAYAVAKELGVRSPPPSHAAA